MKIDISYCSTKYYDKKNICQWMYMYKKYENIKGFIIRVFGIYINIRENDATNKLIHIANIKRELRANNIS